MARKVGQIIARGDRKWLIRVYLGRDHETKKRNYHNRTIRGSMREAHMQDEAAARVEAMLFRRTAGRMVKHQQFGTRYDEEASAMLYSGADL
jgi:hypothetical protein